MNDTATRLRAARALLARPKGWVKGQQAKDVVTTKGEIVAYCMLGALVHVGLTDGRPLWHANPDLIKPWGVSDFNDNPKTLKRDVLAAFDRAIVAAEA